MQTCGGSNLFVVQKFLVLLWQDTCFYILLSPFKYVSLQKLKCTHIYVSVLIFMYTISQGSSIFCANHTFFVSKIAKKELIAPVALLSWATEAKRSWMLFCKEQREQFAHCCSFLKSNKSESLLPLFKKVQLSEERRERYSLGH